MEGISVSLYKGFRWYWMRRNHYERIDGSGRRRRRNRVEFFERVGSERRRRKRFWRIKITPKLHISSPRKLFKRLRDAYVKLMIGFSKSKVFVSGFGGGGMASVGYGGLGRAPPSYDEKVIIEICKSLMSQGHLAHQNDGAAVAVDTL